MIQNIIFDLDGTLLDTSEGILESVKYAAGIMDFPELSEETWLKFIGPPVQNSFMKYYGCSEAEAQKAANIFREYYKSNALLKAKPYEGIFELCDLLKANGFNIAVATYKREDYALKLLKHFNFQKYCISMHGADNNNILKKEDIVQICQNEMSAANKNCVLIGDTVHDAAAAKKCCVHFLAVTYGFGFITKDDIKDFLYIGIANKPKEIAEILLQ